VVNAMIGDFPYKRNWGMKTLLMVVLARSATVNGGDRKIM